MKYKNQSPVPMELSDGTMSFYEALKLLATGKRITKLEWADNKVYGVLETGRVKLHKADDKLYDWVISDGDLAGEDWVLV